jgi:hypothetical protein
VVDAIMKIANEKGVYGWAFIDLPGA